MDAQLTGKDSVYAKRRREHLAIVNQLRTMGAQTELDLPRVAVIGSQSAGKSSLVEAISGISVPRDAGTCTRCPMECRLSSSSSKWRCQISIRWEYSSTGSRLDEIHEMPFGGVIHKKEDVELALRRAQVMVLNPQMPASAFLEMDLDDLKARGSEKNKLAFSKNVVCLDISGPELTDLSFVDLPGLIQNAESNIVELVEDLVLSHIQGNCLILVTLPMSDDIENQKAVRLAKQVDPAGHRTIGVLTKPDMLGVGALKMRDLWLHVIEGRRHPLKHGYYCTRQPDDAERSRGITASEARALEDTYFRQTAPWNASVHRYRLGTKHLIENLSKLLSNVIDESLPKLAAEVKRRLLICDVELDSLPPPITSEPAVYVLNLVTTFCREVAMYIQGDARNASLVQDNRRTYLQYRRDIRTSAPQLLPYTSEKYTASGKDVQLLLEVDDGDDDKNVSIGKVMYLSDIRRHIQRSITRELPNNIPYSAKVVLVQNFQENWDKESRKCFSIVHESLEKLLRNLLRSNFGQHRNLEERTRRVVEELVRVKKDETMKQIFKLLKFEKNPFTQNDHYLSDATERYLAQYKDARAGNPLYDPFASVYARSRRLTLNHNANDSTYHSDRTSTPVSTKATKPKAATLYSTSEQRPQTPTTHVRSETTTVDTKAPDSPWTNSALARPMTLPSAVPAADSPFWDKNASTTTEAKPTPDEERKQTQLTAISALAKLGYTGITVDDLAKLAPVDNYDEELQVMAETRAYFHVSYKRIIDNVPMAIDSEFLFSFSDDLQSFLVKKLGLVAPDSATRCQGYLAEDPAIASSREELTTRKKRLEAVQKELVKSATSF